MENDSDQIKAETIAFLRLFKLIGELREAKDPLARKLLTIISDQRKIFKITSRKTELDELTETLHEAMGHEFSSKITGASAASDYLQRNHPDLYQKMQDYPKEFLIPKFPI